MTEAPLAGGKKRRQTIHVDDVAPTGQPRSPRRSSTKSITVPITPVESQTLQEFVTNQGFIRNELRRLLAVFYWFNGVVLGFVLIIWISDSLDLWFGSAAHARLVTSGVIMSLIAASAAQLGALAFAVGSKVLNLQNTLLSLIGAPATKEAKTP